MIRFSLYDFQKSMDTENNSVNNESNCPSPFPSPISVEAPVNIKDIQYGSPEKITPVKIETESKDEESKSPAVTPSISNQEPMPPPPAESTNATKKTPTPKCQSPLKQTSEPELKKEERIQSPVSPLKEKPETELIKEESIQSPKSPLKPKLESELNHKGFVSPEPAVEAPPILQAVPSTSEDTPGDEKIEVGKAVPLAEESLEPSEEEDEEDDIRELEGRTVSAGGQQVLITGLKNYIHLLIEKNIYVSKYQRRGNKNVFPATYNVNFGKVK